MRALSTSCASSRVLRSSCTVLVTVLLTIKVKCDLPKYCVRESATAPVKQPCAEGYSGCAGVLASGVQLGSGAVAGFPSIPPLRMAVTGRQKLYWYLAFQHPINASAELVQTRANKRAVSARSRPYAPARLRNARAYCAAVFSIQNRAISICFGVRTLLSAAPKIFTWL